MIIWHTQIPTIIKSMVLGKGFRDSFFTNHKARISIEKISKKLRPNEIDNNFEMPSIIRTSLYQFYKKQLNY